MLSRSRGLPSSSGCAPFCLRRGWPPSGDPRSLPSIAQSRRHAGRKSVSVWRQRRDAIRRHWPVVAPVPALAVAQEHEVRSSLRVLRAGGMCGGSNFVVMCIDCSVRRRRLGVAVLGRSQQTCESPDGGQPHAIQTAVGRTRRLPKVLRRGVVDLVGRVEQLARLQYDCGPDIVHATVAGGDPMLAHVRYFESLPLAPYPEATFATVEDARGWIARNPRPAWRSASPQAPAVTMPRG